MAFAIGISVEEFKHLTPYKLESCLKGYNIKRQMRDEEMWYMGQYIMSALDSTVCNAFLWRKKNEKPHCYIKAPALRESIENTRLTSDEIYEKELRKALLAEERWIAAGKRRGLPETIV